MSGSSTSAGTKYFICAAAPATFDEAGYAALAWSEVKKVESIPAFGPTADPVTFQPLDGEEETHKGAVKNGSIQIPHAVVPTDAGQVILRTAAEPGNNALYSHKVLFPDGSGSYFQGRVLGAPRGAEGANSIRKATATVAICTRPVDFDGA